MTFTTRSPFGQGGQTHHPVRENSLFNIENGGALALDNLKIDGAECPIIPGNAVIRTKAAIR
ncbi:MAG: hypothetical protein IPJ00_21685 [Saprospirales bacterium]|nr:hypothetical protein [Saprospirales bacterium]